MPEEITTDGDTKIIDESMLDRLVPVKINGEDKQLPLREVVKGYQLEAASQKRFQEAATAQKSAETAMMIVEDLQQGLTTHDPARLRRAFKNAEIPEETIDKLFAPPSVPVPAGDGDALDDGEYDARDARIDELTRQVQSLNDVISQAQVKGRKLSRRQEVKKALDADTELSKHLGGLDEELRNRFLGLALESAEKASDTFPWGPRAIEAGLNDLKRSLKALGGSSTRRGEETEGEPFGDAEPSSTGLGPASHGVGQLYQSSGRTKPVPLNDPDYAENFDQRFREMIRGK